MTAFTEHNIKKFAPHITPAILEALLVENADALLISGGITTAQRLQHFMGQCYVESGGFTTLSENLNYSATRLRQVWPAKFRSLSVANQYANNPMKLANYVYGNRLGNTDPSDGWKYRGGGILQMTGRYNYSNIAKKTGIDLVTHPDLARDPATALHVAALMWKALGCNDAADDDDVERVTRLVNGGVNGLSDRETATDRATSIFTVPPSAIHMAIGLLDTDAPTQEPGESTDAEAAPSEPKPGPVQVKMTMEQAKQLQQRMKDNNYVPGDIDGNISSPSCVGAIAAVQKSSGLPITGIVDDATEDAIQNSGPKPVSDARESETAQTLKDKGSATIAAADASKSSANGVIATGTGIVAVGGSSLLSTINEQADAVKQVTDHIPGLSERVGGFLTSHWQVFILLAVGAMLLYLAKSIRTSSNTVISERVRKAQIGEDTSH